MLRLNSIGDGWMDELMNMENWWNGVDRENRCNRRKTYSCATLSTTKTTWPSLGSKPDLRGDSTEENVLRRGRNVAGGWENITLYGASQFVLSAEYYYKDQMKMAVMGGQRSRPDGHNRSIQK